MGESRSYTFERERRLQKVREVFGQAQACPMRFNMALQRVLTEEPNASSCSYLSLKNSVRQELGRERLLADEKQKLATIVKIAYLQERQAAAKESARAHRRYHTAISAPEQQHRRKKIHHRRHKSH